MVNESGPKGVNWVMVAVIVLAIIIGGWYLLWQNPVTPESGNSGESGTNESLGRAVLKIEAEDGQFTPAEVSVKRGQTVVIEFTAVDAKYDFGFEDPKIGFDVITEPGETKVFGFESGEHPVGTYAFKCFLFCPNGAMEGVLKIE